MRVRSGHENDIFYWGKKNLIKLMEIMTDLFYPRWFFIFYFVGFFYFLFVLFCKRKCEIFGRSE